MHVVCYRSHLEKNWESYEALQLLEEVTSLGTEHSSWIKKAKKKKMKPFYSVNHFAPDNNFKNKTLPLPVFHYTDISRQDNRDCSIYESNTNTLCPAPQYSLLVSSKASPSSLSIFSLIQNKKPCSPLGGTGCKKPPMGFRVTAVSGNSGYFQNQ